MPFCAAIPAIVGVASAVGAVAGAATKVAGAVKAGKDAAASGQTAQNDQQVMNQQNPDLNSPNPMVRASAMPENTPNDIKAKIDLYQEVLSNHTNHRTRYQAQQELGRLSETLNSMTQGGQLDTKY